ncbi:nitric oxide synthase oxygenase [Phytohabitans rumicis]
MSIDKVRQGAEHFFGLPDLSHVPAERKAQVLLDIEETGTYTHTAEELLIGARLAWRNHARCVGRMHWRSLKLLDFRDRTSADSIADACWEHVRTSTNAGKIEAVISVFPPCTPDGGAIRISNPHLLRYAGYRQPDGSVIGDPATADLTDQVQRLGWQGAGTPFDFLPLVISTPDDGVKWYDVPADAVLEIPIRHPDLPWFEELELKWYANPALSEMALELGGLTYTCAPFTGWYLNTEIGARNFSDEDRYNKLPIVAEKMGLDTSSDRTMWKDRALVELTYAVMHSFDRAGVRMYDHHTAARHFVQYVEREERQGRTVPTDWSWVNPPLSSSTTPAFHRTFDAPDFDVRPNFVRQQRPEI